MVALSSMTMKPKIILDLGIEDVAKQLGVSSATVRRLAKSGKMVCYLVEKQYRFSQRDVDDYIESARLKPEDFIKEEKEESESKDDK